MSKLSKNWGRVEGTDIFNSFDQRGEAHDLCDIDDILSMSDVMDHLDRIHSLVEVCIMALSNPESKGLAYPQEIVTHVLSDYVGPEIQEVEEELKLV